MNENIGNEGKEHRFTSKNQPDPEKKRKPKSLLKAFKKKNNISRDDLRTFVKNILFVKTIPEIREMIKTQEQELPSFFWGLFVVYLKNCAKGNMAALAWMVELVYGKADQKIINENSDDAITKMSRAEMMENIKQMSKKILGDDNAKKEIDKAIRE